MMNILMAHTILGISDLLFWGIVIAIAVIAELATLNLVSIWFIFGAIVSLVASFLGASVALQFALFIVLSGIGFLVFFFVIKPKLANRVVRATNADRIIGEEGTVIQTIDSMTGAGQINVRGQIWSAKIEGEGVLGEGELVKVLDISGVKAVVEPVAEDTPSS